MRTTAHQPVLGWHRATKFTLRSNQQEGTKKRIIYLYQRGHEIKSMTPLGPQRYRVGNRYQQVAKIIYQCRSKIPVPTVKLFASSYGGSKYDLIKPRFDKTTMIIPPPTCIAIEHMISNSQLYCTGSDRFIPVHHTLHCHRAQDPSSWMSTRYRDILSHIR